MSAEKSEKAKLNSGLSPEVIRKIAGLARLSMTEEESRIYSDQLTQVLKYFEQISKVPTDGVEPLVTPSEIEMHWRPDAVQVSTSVQEILANAPEKTGNLFTVPPVV